MTDFEKCIEDVALRLPKLPARRKKNIYDILGVQTKETINSRVLAYFLNAKEEHQFNYLFFDALKELIKEIQDKEKTKEEKAGVDVDNFSGDFNVLTEDTTSRAIEENEKQKRIDVSIEGGDWTIIIENKINHLLNNPLQAYWEHAIAKFPKNVVGVILSIPKLPQKECVVNDEIKYINITHKELIRRVQKNLIIGTKTNDINLFYLKEYIKTIESHYKSITDQPRMNDIVNALVKQGKQVRTIQYKVDESIKFIDNEIIEIFKSYGYKKVKNWFTNGDKHRDLFFWVHDSRKIVLENYLWFCFETRNQTNAKLDTKDLSTLYADFAINDSKITHGNLDRSKEKTHIAKYSQTDFLNDKESFREAFTHVLESYFMAENDGIVDKTIAYLIETNETINNSIVE